MNVYDFDGTIYPGDSTVDFYLYCLRKKPGILRFVPQQGFGFLRYKLKSTDKRGLKEAFFSFLKGLDAEKLAEEFWATRAGEIYDWYLEQKAEDDLIISASPEFLLRPVCRKLGVSALMASPVDPETGKFRGENCRGKEKVRRFRALYGDERPENFYSDSLSDLPMARLSRRAWLIEKGEVKKWALDGGGEND